MIEKRKYRRSPCKAQTTTILTSPSGRVVGSLVDISDVGARFHYVDLGRHLEKDTDLKITLKKDADRLELPCRLIWERTRKSPSLFNVVHMREGGVLFTEPIPESSASC